MKQNESQHRAQVLIQPTVSGFREMNIKNISKYQKAQGLWTCKIASNLVTFHCHRGGLNNLFYILYLITIYFLYRRGNPLHLCPDRYHKLQKLWLRHSIPEEIAHSLELNANLLSIDWQHLWLFPQSWDCCYIACDDLLGIPLFTVYTA